MNRANSQKSQLLMPANMVTLARICLVPVFVVALLSPWPDWLGLRAVINDDVKSLVAAAVFVFISCTDWLDGYLARKRNEVTDFGKFVDPLADKILVAAALLALVQLQVLPSWPVLIILTREFIVAGVRMIAASKHEVIAASWYGKAKTVAQIVAIVLFLVKDSISFPNADDALHDPLYLTSWLVMLIALALTIISMLDYIAQARHLLGFGAAAFSDEGARAGTDDIREDEVSDLACALIRDARERKVSLATAESLTGGMISCALTSVPGSSAVFQGGVASYAIQAKERVLGVDARTLSTEGVVSIPVAVQMAQGARSLLTADLAVAVTGIAGPGGAEPSKPVGTVCLAVCGAEHTVAHELHLEGDRDHVRLATTYHALRALHDALLER